jgi:ATP synthase protein I
MTTGGHEPSGKKFTPGRSQEQNAGWTIFSYLLSGMAVYGLVGWLVARLTHIAVLFPVGMLVGLALAILLIVLKYGRA